MKDKKVKPCLPECADEDVVGRWHYVEKELKNASGYCTKCGQHFVYSKEVNALVRGGK